jgi:hypothetical protein
MNYEDVKPGQTVKINVPSARGRGEGTVVSKEVVDISSKHQERVYVNCKGMRRVCSPLSLELVDDA